MELADEILEIALSEDVDPNDGDASAVGAIGCDAESDSIGDCDSDKVLTVVGMSGFGLIEGGVEAPALDGDEDRGPRMDAVEAVGLADGVMKRSVLDDSKDEGEDDVKDGVSAKEDADAAMAEPVGRL